MFNNVWSISHEILLTVITIVCTPFRHICCTLPSSPYAHLPYYSLNHFLVRLFSALCLAFVVSHDTHNTDKIRSKNKFCVSSCLLFFFIFLFILFIFFISAESITPLHPPFLYGNLVDGNHKIYMLLFGRTVISKHPFVSMHSTAQHRAHTLFPLHLYLLLYSIDLFETFCYDCRIPGLNALVI